MHATQNGRARRSLADQLDRLDRTLDGLAEGLNEAVATAVQEAVRGVLAELLADANLRAQYQGAARSAPKLAPAMVTVTATTKLRDGFRRAWHGLRAQLHTLHQILHDSATCTTQACRQRWNQLTSTCASARRRVRDRAVAGWHRLWILRHVGPSLLAALMVGGTVGVAAFFAGPTLAAAASGVCGFVTTLTVRTRGWLHRNLLPMSVAG